MSAPQNNVWTIVVAGGSGSRFGGLKQFAELSGRRMVDWAVETAAKASTGVIVVVEANGGYVVVVDGEVENKKITSAADLEWARSMVINR